MAGFPSDSDDVVEDGRDGAVVRIRVKPRSSRRGVLGAAGGSLIVGVGAAPEGGKATAEAIRTVAAWLGLAPSRMRLISGASSRSKRLLVAGEPADRLRGIVASALARTGGERGARKPHNGP